MSLALASIPLAMVAGALSIMSPCVWPLVPIVMTSASGKGRWGPLYLALGLSIAFALAGGLLTYVFLNIGVDPGALRWVAALLLVVIGLTLIYKPLADKVSHSLSLISGRLPVGNVESNTAMGQFGIGMLLGLVWLPCVGPTLGAAIALASMGQSLVMASVVMFAFGIGTASALIAAAFVSEKLLTRWRPGLFSKVASAKIFLGYLLLLLGIMVLTGVDKMLETLALTYLPTWTVAL